MSHDNGTQAEQHQQRNGTCNILDMIKIHNIEHMTYDGVAVVAASRHIPQSLQQLVLSSWLIMMMATHHPLKGRLPAQVECCLSVVENLLPRCQELGVVLSRAGEVCQIGRGCRIVDHSFQGIWMQDWFPIPTSNFFENSGSLLHGQSRSSALDD